MRRHFVYSLNPVIAAVDIYDDMTFCVHIIFLTLSRRETWPLGHNFFFMLSLTEHEIVPLINVKMPTIVGILTFMSRKIAF